MTLDVRGWLRQLPISVYLVIAGLTAVGAAYAGWAHYQQEIGKRDLLIAQGERTNADLRHAQDSLAKVYRVDTLRLTRYRTQMDTQTVTVEQWKHDTLKVVEYVAKADTTIKACVQALQTCDQRVGVAQRGWDGARAEIAILKKQMPGKLAPWRDRAIGVAAGYAIGRLLKP